jgi:hypothetical protein
MTAEQAVQITVAPSFSISVDPHRGQLGAICDWDEVAGAALSSLLAHLSERALAWYGKAQGREGFFYLRSLVEKQTCNGSLQ